MANEVASYLKGAEKALDKFDTSVTNILMN